jgi:ribosomal protein S18 acetylase RimI-like enzyme
MRGSRASRSCGTAASLAVVVDALNDRAAAFYRRYGFLPFADDAHRLYLPMATVMTLLS